MRFSWAKFIAWIQLICFRNYCICRGLSVWWACELVGTICRFNCGNAFKTGGYAGNNTQIFHFPWDVISVLNHKFVPRYFASYSHFAGQRWLATKQSEFQLINMLIFIWKFKLIKSGMSDDLNFISL